MTAIPFTIAAALKIKQATLQQPILTFEPHKLVKGCCLFHLYGMHTFIKQQWTAWLQRHRRRIAARQLQKQATVLQNGIPLYVLVLNVYPTRVSMAQQQLVRLQLRIRLLNNTHLYTVSLAFIHAHQRHLKGQFIRIKFLPGDLSHVVIVI